MTLTTPYSATFYVGDGETKTFPYLFEEVSESFISVIVYNSLTGQSSTPTYIVDTDQKQVIFGDDTPAPTADETVCIYRNTPNVQDTPFRTLQGYDAKALENILSKIVAMIQEIKSNYFTTQVLQGDPWQLDLLTSADDGATVNIDYTAKKLVKGLCFKITDGNLQVSADGSEYITMPKSVDVAEFRQFSITLEDLSVIKKLQYRVDNEWFDAEANAQATADEALALAQTVQGGLSSHVSNVNNPHETSIGNLTDTDFTNLQTNQFLKFNGTKWVNVSYSSICGWGGIIGNITDQTDLMNKFTEYVKTDGSSTMTNPLMMRATDDFKCAIAPYWDGVGFFKLNDNNSVTLMASIEYNSGFEPATTNTYNIGALTRKWKNLYLAGKAYMSVINNGYDIAVPVTNSADTLALKSQVDDAANSGEQLYTTGVWYAKMYAATVVPTGAEYDGRNYADFSQVDSDNNPVIKIYTGASGAWTLTETITPPANHNGYMTITSKIWDIAEQSGQQGGLVLWSHNQKTFTPYPRIVSFESINITGDSTVVMPAVPTNNSIPSKKYVDDKVRSSIGNGTITLTQSGNIMGTFTTNQGGDTTIALDGGSSYHPDLFDVKWADHICNDVQWLRADTFSWQSGAVYQAAYQHLADDLGQPLYGWSNSSHTIVYRTLSEQPEAGDAIYVWDTDHYIDSRSVVTSVAEDYSYIVYNGTKLSRRTSDDTYLTYTKETIAGTDIYFYQAADGHKICPASEESNVQAIYNATGVAWYYMIDTLFNQRFKLPRRHSQQIVRSVKNADGSWYRLYADGWVEQGGLQTSSSGSSGVTVTLPVAMADANYTITATVTGEQVYFVGCLNKTATSFLWRSFNRLGEGYDKAGSWQVSGQSAIDMSSFQDGEKYLYFYVGNFTQTALENTAGLNAELFNGKVDVGHEVIAFQRPTAQNNYTWYRKYADGWVEQGGRGTLVSSSYTANLPVTMADTNYFVFAGTDVVGVNNSVAGRKCTAKTTTSVTITGTYASGGSTNYDNGGTIWQVKGMAAS